MPTLFLCSTLVLSVCGIVSNFLRAPIRIKHKSINVGPTVSSGPLLVAPFANLSVTIHLNGESLPFKTTFSGPYIHTWDLRINSDAVKCPPLQRNPHSSQRGCKMLEFNITSTTRIRVVLVFQSHLMQNYIANSIYDALCVGCDCYFHNSMVVVWMFIVVLVCRAIFIRELLFICISFVFDQYDNLYSLQSNLSA